jgi:hypothetical protein
MITNGNIILCPIKCINSTNIDMINKSELLNNLTSTFKKFFVNKINKREFDDMNKIELCD